MEEAKYELYGFNRGSEEEIAVNFFISLSVVVSYGRVRSTSYVEGWGHDVGFLAKTGAFVRKGGDNIGNGLWHHLAIVAVLLPFAVY